MPITIILGTIQSLILFLLAVLHLSWALGSKWGYEQSLPTNESGKRILNPGKKDCTIVGVGLLLFAVFYRIKIGIIPIDLPPIALTGAAWIIPIIFLLRSMGDFKYVGFFKRVKTTEFAINDTKYYSPLCLFMGINGLAIEWLS